MSRYLSELPNECFRDHDVVVVVIVVVVVVPDTVPATGAAADNI